MSFTKSLINKTASLSNKNWYKDLLASESLKNYFLSKEAIQAYCSDIGVGERREIALVAESVLISFLNYDYTEEEECFIDDLLCRNSKIINKLQNQKQDIGLYERLKNLDEDGVKLLNIDEDIDSKKLKSLYRKASFKYHPDHGGSSEDMQKINKAYSLFSDAERAYVPINAENRVSYYKTQPESLNEWKFTCYLVLSCIQGDFFAADYAFESIKKAFDYSKESSSSYVGNFSFDLFTKIDTLLSKCCGALSRMGMKDELSEAAEITLHFIDLYIKHWKPIHEYDVMPSWDNYPTKNDFESGFTTKIIIKHPEQAKNAFRLGKIDEKSFQTAIKKYSEKKALSTDQAELLKSFYKSLCPKIAITKSSYSTKVVNPEIVAPKNYFQDRFDFLDENQKWEYVKAYNLEIDSSFLIKYIDIRVTDLLIGVIKNYDSLDLNKIIKELDFLEKKFSNLRLSFSGIKEIIEHLESLEKDVRSKKLNLLTELDNVEQRSHRHFYEVKLTYHPKNGYKQRIEASDTYVEFVQMSYEEILCYKKIGKFNNDFSSS